MYTCMHIVYTVHVYVCVCSWANGWSLAYSSFSHIPLNHTSHDNALNWIFVVSLTPSTRQPTWMPFIEMLWNRSWKRNSKSSCEIPGLGGARQVPSCLEVLSFLKYPQSTSVCGFILFKGGGKQRVVFAKHLRWCFADRVRSSVLTWTVQSSAICSAAWLCTCAQPETT